MVTAKVDGCRGLGEVEGMGSTSKPAKKLTHEVSYVAEYHRT